LGKNQKYRGLEQAYSWMKRGLCARLARTHARSQVGTFVWRNQAILSRV